MSSISVVILTLNAEQHLEACLNAVSDLADEILILDSGSTDATLEIAAKHGCNIQQVEWKGYAQTKNDGNGVAAGDYILSLDSDEVLSDELKASIQSVKDSGLQGAYSFNRLNNYYGHWLHHGGFYPDKKVRLFPKGAASWQGDFVHEDMVLQPGTNVTHLPGDLLHYTTDSVADHLDRINKYSTLAAQGMLAQGKSPGFFKLVFSPIWRFKKIYFFKGGFRDGRAGLVVALMSAYAVMLRYAKLWQLKNSNNS